MSADSVQDCLVRARVLGKTLEAELLLAVVLDISREQVFSNPSQRLSPEQLKRFLGFWGRIEAGEPVAYLLGKKEFYGLEFKVDSRVLIPRPETEHLVETTLALVSGIESPRILDVGTGCGAIALALKSVLLNAQVWGSDVSGEAIDMARENSERLDLKVEFFISDLLNEVSAEVDSLDVLVANLPYIGRKEFHFIEKSVQDYEPDVALFGGSDGLRLYDQLFEQINCSILRPRWVLGEFGSLQREVFEEMIVFHFPEVKVDFHQDLAGLDRYFVLDLNHAG